MANADSSSRADIGLRALDGRELSLDLAEPDEIGIAAILGQSALGRPQLVM
jgi:hypothetical protein